MEKALQRTVGNRSLWLHPTRKVQRTVLEGPLKGGREEKLGSSRARKKSLSNKGKKIDIGKRK